MDPKFLAVATPQQLQTLKENLVLGRLEEGVIIESPSDTFSSDNI